MTPGAEKLYKFLTQDPPSRERESFEDFRVRRLRRLRLQKLLISSFPKEFERLDVYIHNQRIKAVKGDKEGMVGGSITTFTGRERLATAMLVPIRQQLRQESPLDQMASVLGDEEEPLPVEKPLKALQWLKTSRWAELDPKPV